MSKVIKMDLVKRLENGTEDIQVKIEPMRFGQFTGALNVISEIFDILEENPGLREMLIEIFTGASEFDASQYAGYEAEEIAAFKKEYESNTENRWLLSALSSFKAILSRLPDQGIRLLAAMSNIPDHLLNDQEYDVVFDVMDAIFEVNDMEQVYNRGKQSFSVVRNAFQFIKIQKEEEQEKMLPQ